MSQVLAIFGATGHQGKSVVNSVLSDPALSVKYKIRAITRDTNSIKAKELKDKVEVVYGDVLDRNSVEAALIDVHTVFAMTTPTFGPGGFEAEYASGKTIADVAVEKGAEYVIFSTLPSIKEISKGKYTKCSHFDAKAAIEQHIRGLNVKSAFYSPGGFMENFIEMPLMSPQKGPKDTWVIALHTSPQAKLPLIDAVGDTGKYIGAILAEPEKYEGKTFHASTALYSWEQIAAIMSKATGKTIIYKQISVEEFKETLPFEPDVFVEVFSFGEEFGYFGAESENLVAWAAKNARGRVVTLEEYLYDHPLQLAEILQKV